MELAWPRASKMGIPGGPSSNEAEVSPALERLFLLHFFSFGGGERN